MAYLGGSENYIQNCDISLPTGGPAACTAIVVNPAGGAVYISNTHLSDFAIGIQVKGSPNLTRLFCSNVICESSANAVIIGRQATPQKFTTFFSMTASSCRAETATPLLAST